MKAPWTNEDEAKLASLHLQEPMVPIEKVCSVRTPSSVVARLMRLRLRRVPGGKMRRCMHYDYCKTTIYSTWVGERFCFACRAREGVRLMPDIIDFLEATQPPPQTFDVQCRVIRLRGQEFTVETSINTATRRGYQKVTRANPGVNPETIIAVWGCGDGEDLGIAEIVVKAWLNGFDPGWLRGREALCNEIHDPELQG